VPAVLVTGPTVTQNSPFSSLVLAVTIASTHFAYPRRDDPAAVAWVAWLNTEMVYSWTVTHLSTNPAQHRVTSLMCPMTLPLSQTGTHYICYRWLDNLPSMVATDQRELWEAFLCGHEPSGTRHSPWPDQPSWNVQGHGRSDGSMDRLRTSSQLSHCSRCGRYQLMLPFLYDHTVGMILSSVCLSVCLSVMKCMLLSYTSYSKTLRTVN